MREQDSKKGDREEERGEIGTELRNNNYRKKGNYTGENY